jgi:DNA-binding Xre family transcriptional regulator
MTMMQLKWRLRMVAAEHGIWTGTELQRALASKAGYKLSSPSISVLLTKQPRELKLTTLTALCTALECTPNDLLQVVHTTADSTEHSTI